MMMSSLLATWGIAAGAIAGVIFRPLKIAEAVFAMCGAAMLVIFGLLPWRNALVGIGKGLDVYLFLAGMMLLAELARREGLFDWLAARAAVAAGGSATRLFGLVYAVGILVTVFLSNDATAVVLTPAVAAVARAAEVANPLPYLLICALVANAASFVLPISNPANLVIFSSHMPPLLQWLGRFAVPSIMSIAATYFILRWMQRQALKQTLAHDVPLPALSSAGKVTAWGIGATATVLMVASASSHELGMPTCIAGITALVIVSFMNRTSPWLALREISWGVVPLVAGLFVLVEALSYTGVIERLSEVLGEAVGRSARMAALGVGLTVGVGSNLVNNLPAGLIAGTALQAVDTPAQIASAALIGIDLGPNLSVTGSLATILWLNALRREGLHVGAWDFLKVGVWVMPPALLLALGALIGLGS
jgi:arsenical pump membrane protein